MPFDPRFNIETNDCLRIPQRDGWKRIREHYQDPEAEREIGIVLPVGCGKSGLISITPYAMKVRRALIIAPGTKIREQLADDMRANSATNFYQRCKVLSPEFEFPEAAVVASGRVNLDDLRHCDIAVANIHQISGEENQWLDAVGPEFFDLILVDEAHHNPAESWQQVKRRFPNARIVNFSATPTRADGRLMEGRLIYSFPILRAIEEGYVKRLRAKMLRPSELRYVDRSAGEERVIGPEEVRKLGEENAEFRRGIVMSDHTLGSIVDQSIAELRRLRGETGEGKLKIIASALNQDHCIQITEAFRGRNLRAAYVHSREGTEANQRVFAQLERHDLDVIVQARMLTEGFDHKYLAVAMVGSIFANLGPFVQFVGRVMRAIKPSSPGHPLNQAVVVFHLGGNVAQRWNDFRKFSLADQDYFAQLLPEVEEIEFKGEVVEREPGGGGIDSVEVLEERGVRAADMEPIGDPQAAELLRQIAAMGVTPEQAAHEIQRIRMTRQDRRVARRAALNDREQNEAGGILRRLQINPGGRTLDPAHRKNNVAWTIAELHRRINEHVGGANADRQNFTLDQLDQAHNALPDIVHTLEEQLGHGV
ncbi:DEAD/DEAH box helicase [Nitrospira moscoviensis]|uniref:Putative helicase n=1 Tax=Nitrospira moscoviensis TaxID=42253 RepID=A0A0K2GGT4_NITMO|nr:DEAD/DEAH box helicase family protein [Nitrospira moscoviensis]ALA60178.1 putative helicase [Nitrospira moscoviensis]